MLNRTSDRSPPDKPKGLCFSVFRYRALQLSCLCFFALFSLVATGPSFAKAGKDIVKVPLGTDPNSVYARKLLDLIFDNIDQTFIVRRASSDQLVTVARSLQNAEEGIVDIIWTATNREVERRLIPIRIPIFKGLMGYRICFVHRSNQNLFEDIESLDRLLPFTMGQGRGWTDSEILLSNGFKVVETSKWPSLFHMTDGQRFDAYPRGLHEPWNELPMIREWGLDLVVDKHVMLVYRMPFYLFVTPRRPDLALLIEKSFEDLVVRGEFQKFFLSSGMLKGAIENGHLNTRKRFYLDNPNLPAKTPVDRKELWLESLDILKQPSAT